MRSPKRIRSLVDANCVSNSCRESVRIISAEGELFAMAQRDRYASNPETLYNQPQGVRSMPHPYHQRM